MSLRVQSAPAFFGVILCVGAVFYGCASEEQSFLPGPSGQGGAVSSTGGAIAYATGGYKPATYVQPQAGNTAVGTKAGTSVTAGGSTGANTVVGNGGTTGVTTSTGVTATGGTVTTTTATVNPNTGKAVTFKAGKAEGAMSGYGFVALGKSDSISSPTCGASKVLITSTTPCAADPNWSSATALCVSGSIPANTAKDYTNNWGLLVGVNATNPSTGGLNQAHTAVTIDVTGAPLTGLRAKVHRKGDAAGTDYCAVLTSGTAMPLTSFTTTCYDPAKPGTAITTADIPNIDQISVQVSSDEAAAITVTDLCITGITFT